VCRLAVFYAVLAGLVKKAVSVHRYERGDALGALSAARWLGKLSQRRTRKVSAPSLRLLLGWRPETHSVLRLERLSGFLGFCWSSCRSLFKQRRMRLKGKSLRRNAVRAFGKLGACLC